MSVEVQYTILINVDRDSFFGYKPEHQLVQTWQGTVELPSVDMEGIRQASEALFVKHNRDNRPDGKVGPSLSVGDVVLLGEVAMGVASIGFEPVEVPQESVITDRSWSQVLDDIYPRSAR